MFDKKVLKSQIFSKILASFLENLLSILHLDTKTPKNKTLLPIGLSQNCQNWFLAILVENQFIKIGEKHFSEK